MNTISQRPPIVALMAWTLLFLTGYLCAADIRMTGSPAWKIANNRCTVTFNNDTQIENISAPNNLSGTLRVCMILTRDQFPSAGYRISTYTLGQLKGGYHYSDFYVTAPLKMPKVTGQFNFTVAVEQYTPNGWVLSAYGLSDSRYLKAGRFSTPPRWSPPKGAIKAPATSLEPGRRIILVHKGGETNDGYINYIPKGSQLKLQLKLGESGTGMIYGGTRPEGAPVYYNYSTASDDYGGKTHQVGRLYLDFGGPYGVVSYGDHTLFFKGRNKGFYKSRDVTDSIQFSGTSWGLFTLKPR